MPVFTIILKELAYRKWNFLFSAVGVMAASALFTAFHTASSAAVNETRRVTRDMGFNIRIIPSNADPDEFWANGYSDETMPEATLQQLAQYKDVFLSFNHLVATLQKRIEIDGKPALLHGIAPTIAEDGKKPMGYQIKSGTLNLGFRIAHRLNLKKGDSMTLMGETFKVATVLSESGSDDDIRIYGLLSDVQRLLGQEGRINEIKAIDCLCLTKDENPMEQLRKELEKALPQAQVFQIQNIANARAHQRQMVGQYFDKMSPVILTLASVWVAALCLMNVRERRYEIGLLRALGKGALQIAVLFQVKAMIIGLVGGLLGTLLGAWAAVRLGPGIFKIASVTPDPSLMTAITLAAAVFSAVVCFIPSMMAVAQEPAEILKHE